MPSSRLGLAQNRQQQQQFSPNEERLSRLSSNLYLALATTQQPKLGQQDQNVSKKSAVVDFEVYNFRKFMRDFFMRSLIHYERAQRGVHRYFLLDFLFV